MASHTYVTKGYSNYSDVRPQEGGYVYGPNQHDNWYVVETTTVERFHVPPNGYNNFDGEYHNFDDRYNNYGGTPLKNGYPKEHMSKYAPRGHHEIYELKYGSDNANGSPHGYHERDDLMDNFLNKLQIGASRPMKSGNLPGPTKYRPTSPNKYRSKSPTYGYPSREPHFIPAQYLPPPNRYQPISPSNYQPLSPNKYHPNSPTKYRPISPDKYRRTSPTKYRPISPDKYRPTSPTKYRPTSPNKYRSTSPIKYHPTSPTKYRPKSPTKYQPTNMTKFQHANSGKYQLSSPTNSYPLNENHMFTAQNLPEPDNNKPTNPLHNIPSREIQPIRTQTISGPNKSLPSSPGPNNSQNVKSSEFSDPTNPWQTESPPGPHRQLTTPTNDINEALRPITELANNSPRAQPLKHENRFGWNALGATTRRFMKSDAIDSKEAIKKYNGAHVP